MASSSSYERVRLRRALACTMWAIEDVYTAQEAAGFCEANGGNVVLLIDGGLVAETAAAQDWRLLRERYPDLGAVVRGLIPRDGGIVRNDPATILVHPDDHDGLHEALRLLHCDPASALS